MKKFETLGKSLSKNEMKKIMGGDEQDLGRCGSTCSNSCQEYCRGELTTGECSISSGGNCYCYVLC